MYGIDEIYGIPYSSGDGLYDYGVWEEVMEAPEISVVSPMPAQETSVVSTSQVSKDSDVPDIVGIKEVIEYVRPEEISNYFSNISSVRAKFGTSFIHDIRSADTAVEIENAVERAAELDNISFVYLLFDMYKVSEVFRDAIEIFDGANKLSQEKQKDLVSMFFAKPEISDYIDNVAPAIKNLLNRDEKYDKENELVSVLSWVFLDPTQSGVLYSVYSLLASLILPHENLKTYFKEFESLIPDYFPLLEECMKLKPIIYKSIQIPQSKDSWLLRTSTNYSEVSLSYKKLLQSLGFFVEDVVKKTVEVVETTADFAESAWDWIVSGSLTASISFIAVSSLGLYIIKKLADYILQPRSNPLLMSVNPPPDLWKYAKSLKSDLKEGEFREAIQLFRAQHGRDPKQEDMKISPSDHGFPVLVEVGRVNDITYDPPEGRKRPYKYIHKMGNTKLFTDISGENLILVGNTFMDKNDGWLKM